MVLKRGREESIEKGLKVECSNPKISPENTTEKDMKSPSVSPSESSPATCCSSDFATIISDNTLNQNIPPMTEIVPQHDPPSEIPMCSNWRLALLDYIKTPRLKTISPVNMNIGGGEWEWYRNIYIVAIQGVVLGS